MNTKDLVYVALFAAIVAVLGLLPKIQLLSGVPITAQSLGVMLAGGILGARRGALSLAVFVLLVVAGLPLLAGGRGGWGILAGPSGGFLLGFPVAAYVIGRLIEYFWERLNHLLAFIACGCGGVIALYACGAPWMAMVGGFTPKQAMLLLLPFLPGDIIKAIIAAILIMVVKRAYPIINIRL